MAIDKNKIIEAATKFVQKGQYDKAIKEYQKLLEADPKDARVQQKLGELYQKKGDNALAAECFLKVAESYSADGFFLKAVAVYKQVLKLNPALVDVNLKLAELHQQLGLMSDAMAQYQLVANHYEKSGNIKASLDTLRRMVDLDPDNVASRIKLAELYARENMNPEAIAEFGRAAEYLKRNNRVDDYIKVAERLVFLDPNNLELTRELANIYLTKQDTKRALAKLQLCFKADPKDVETLSMLAQAFKDLGQVSKTVSVYKELAKIYDEQDRVDEEREVWRKITELAPDDPDARAKLPKPAAPEPAPAPAAAPARAAAPAAGTAAAAPGVAKGSLDQIPKLLTETDVYVKYGLHEKAIDHLKKVFAIDPDSIDGHEKAADLNALTGNSQGALEGFVKVVGLCISAGDLERARSNLQKLCEKDPSHPEIPGFLEAVGGLAPVEEVAEIEEDAILVDAADEAIEVAPEPAQVDLSIAPEAPIEAAADSDDDALAAAAAELAAEEPGGEMIAEAPADEELIAAPPDGDDLALATAESSADLIEPDADALLAEAEPLAEPPGEEFVEAAEPEADEVLAAAEPEAEEMLASAEPEAPFEPPVESEPEFGEPLEGPGSGFEDEPLDTTLPGRMTLSGAVPPADEEEIHEEATRVADLNALLAQGAPRTPAPAPFEETGDDEATSVLPAVEPTPVPQRLAAAPTPVPQRVAAEPAPRPAVAKPAPAAKPSAVEKAAPAPKPVPAAKPAVAEKPATSEKPAAKRPAAAVATKPAPAPEPEPVEPEPAEDPASDELDEAQFFLDQGMFEEAREIVETVMLAYPGSARAQELLARLDQAEQGGTPPAEEAPAPAAPEGSTDGSFDLASELANEDLGDLGAPAAGGTDDFQYSVEDVFDEFKKGLKKVVKPEDVDTHYDLGIAYKEMGLLEDAIGEFEQAASAAAGKKKELESLAMVGLCRVERSEFGEAAAAFQRALSLAQVTPETAKAVHFELGLVLEKMGRADESLGHFLKVQKLDPKFRDVGEAVQRLIDAGAQEEQTQPAKPPARTNGSAAKPAARAEAATGSAEAPPPKPAAKGKKIGYV